MEKIKVDLLIKGNLICEKMLTGGGVYPSADLERYFDVSDAVTIDGDLVVQSFDSKEHTVAVCGFTVVKGGDYER